MNSLSLLSEYPHLTRPEFDACVERFLARYSSSLSASGTCFEQRTSRAGRQYLVLRRAIYAESIAVGTVAESTVFSETDIEDDDPVVVSPASTQEGTSDGTYIEYHVVYSATWRVPVLYVRVVLSDGEVVLDGAQVCDMVTGDAQVRQAMTAVPFGGALGVADHPELNAPFLYLHPCHTADLLRAVVPSSLGCNEMDVISVGPDEYLAAWLSLSGPAVGLALPACGNAVES
ncbi:E2-like conjugating enzyme atg10 [Coemansia sp. BCRC 34301]|nr:E2-like conjugating enzyme atg10 [Coemansia sp. BCRC 34301]